MPGPDEPWWLTLAYAVVGGSCALCAVGILFWVAFLR